MSAFELYWRFLGLPLSRAKGLLVDAVPFSLVETALWIGGAASAIWIASYLRPMRGRLSRRKAFFLGPVMLAALGLGQGAFPLSLAPTAWRISLSESRGDSLAETRFRDWAAEREARLRREFHWSAYAALGEEEALAVCDRELDSVLSDQGLTRGRKVRKAKPMGALTGALGLIYGGPAFHDPFFGEIGIVRAEAYPTPRHWRNIAACHEAAHAKGFTREMDAEVLTQLALLRAGTGDPRFRILADVHFLNKTGSKVRWPDSLKTESRRARAARREALDRRPVVSALRGWAERWNLRNSPRKYGDRDRDEPWNPRHPFFATVHGMAREP